MTTYPSLPSVTSIVTGNTRFGEPPPGAKRVVPRTTHFRTRRGKGAQPPVRALLRGMHQERGLGLIEFACDTLQLRERQVVTPLYESQWVARQGFDRKNIDDVKCQGATHVLHSYSPRHKSK